jgi:hypothetical protein
MAARNIALAVVVGLALGACTTLGTGSGVVEASGQPVRFNWISKDGGVTGTMSATLANGSTFSGPYLEVTSTQEFTSYAPIFAGWPAGWRDWGYGRLRANVPYGGFAEGDSTDYTGTVVANLQGPGTQRMRCRFNLIDPPSGVKGGGQGECQDASGVTIDATFPRA